MIIQKLPREPPLVSRQAEVNVAANTAVW